MTRERLTLGEYVRRLRRGKAWSLGQAAEAADVSYSYFSRVENESAVPTAETLAKIASALDGDLQEMLALADWLPSQLLERMANRQSSGSTGLQRTAFRPLRDEGGVEVAALAKALGIEADEARDLLPIITALTRLEPQQRSLVRGVIDLLKAGEGPSG